MNQRKCICLCSIIMFYGYLINAQNLSSSSNYHFYTSSKNLTYIGSLDGLNVYDGQTNQKFKPITYPMIGRNIQGEFIEDNENRVWFATYTGLNVHLPDSNTVQGFQFTVNDTLVDHDYRTIALTGDTLWVQAGAYTNLFNTTKGKLITSFKTEVEDYFSFSAEKKSNLVRIYCAGYSGLKLLKINLITNVISSETLLSEPIRTILKKDNEIYLGTFNKGLILVDLDQNTKKVIYSTKNTINKISQYNSEIVVNVDHEGSFILNKILDKYTLEQIKGSEKGPNYSFGYIDNFDVLWEGIENNPPRAIDLDKKKFNHFLKGHSITSISRHDNILIVGVRGDKFMCLNLNNLLNGSETIITKSIKTHPSKVEVIGNKLLTYYNGIRYLDKTNGSIALSLPNSNIDRYMSNYIHLENKLILIPGDQFVYSYNFDTQSIDTLFESEKAITNGMIHDNQVYFSHDDVRISSYELKDGILNRKSTFPSIKGEIKSVQNSNHNDSILLSTVQGLFIAHRATGQSRSLMDSDGLMSTTFYSAYIDTHGFIWCSSNEGILKYNLSTNKVHQFTKADGVQENEFNTHAHLQLEDGTILFGGINGLNIFHPDSISLSQKEAPVLLSNYKINDTESQKFGVPLVLSTMQLPYEENTLSFQFHAIDYGDPEASIVKYKLIGVDDEYVESTSAKGEIRYANLSPGSYTLSLIGANSDGVWNTSEKTIDISISPPYWQTWWFRLLVVIGLGSLIFALFRYYYRQQLARKDFELREQALIIERQNALQAERTRIAGEMHDDLGGGLTSIRFLSQKVLRHLKDTDQKQELDKIVNHSQSLVNNMSEIIWAMNAGFDTLENLIAYCRRYAYEYLEPYSIDIKFITQGNYSGIEVSGERRRNIFLVIKEALHNIVKHSQADVCKISFSYDDILELTIADNGIGLQTEQIQLGNGLTNMKKRIKNLGGQLVYNNSKEGLEIKIHLSLEKEI